MFNQIEIIHSEILIKNLLAFRYIQTNFGQHYSSDLMKVYNRVNAKGRSFKNAPGPEYKLEQIIQEALLRLYALNICGLRALK